MPLTKTTENKLHLYKLICKSYPSHWQLWNNGSSDINNLVSKESKTLIITKDLTPSNRGNWTTGSEPAYRLPAYATAIHCFDEFEIIVFRNSWVDIQWFWLKYLTLNRNIAYILIFSTNSRWLCKYRLEWYPHRTSFIIVITNYREYIWIKSSLTPLLKQFIDEFI